MPPFSTKRRNDRPLAEVASAAADPGELPGARTHAVRAHRDTGPDPAFVEIEDHAAFLDPDSLESGGPEPAHGLESGKPGLHRVAQGAVFHDVSERRDPDVGGIEVNLSPSRGLPYPHFRKRARPPGLQKPPDSKALENRSGSGGQRAHPSVVAWGGARARRAGFDQGHPHARRTEGGAQGGAHRPAPDDGDVVHHGASPLAIRLAGKPSPIA